MLQMRDEPYPSDRIAAYGAHEQPAIVARMRPHLQLTRAGTVAALVAVGLALGGLVSYPNFGPTSRGFGWAVTVLVCGVVLLAICVVQLVVWQRAMAAWAGRRAATLGRMPVLSWVAHLGSYAVVLVALYAAITASSDAGWSATAAVLLALALAAMVAAQVTAGVQYLRSSGPPGTIPTHMRRLLEREAARRRTPRSRPN